MTGNAKASVLPVTADLFEIAASAAPCLVWMSGLDRLCSFVSKGWLDFTGRPIELELGSSTAQTQDLVQNRQNFLLRIQKLTPKWLKQSRPGA